MLTRFKMTPWSLELVLVKASLAFDSCSYLVRPLVTQMRLMSLSLERTMASERPMTGGQSMMMMS